MRRIISGILAVSLVLTMTLAGNMSVSAETEGNYTYVINGSNATITEYTGPGGSVTVPNTLGGYSVTEIGLSAFQELETITTIALPSTLLIIGEAAFRHCSSLSSISIPNGVTSIGNEAFLSTDLISVSIPNSVTSIGDSAFSSCSELTNITLSSNITSIGPYTFATCRALTSITIPNGVTSIGERAFTDCDALASVVIPNSVTSIGNWAFYYCSFTNLTLPNSVESIGKNEIKWFGSVSLIPRAISSIISISAVVGSISPPVAQIIFLKSL